jgi:hypothetical protein
MRLSEIESFDPVDSKEETARPYPEAAAREGKNGVVRTGTRQNKVSVWSP